MEQLPDLTAPQIVVCVTRDKAVDDEQRQQQLDERWKRGMASSDMRMIGGAAADVDVPVIQHRISVFRCLREALLEI